MIIYTEVGPHGSKDLNNTGPQVPMTQQIVRKGGSCPEGFRLGTAHALGRGNSDSAGPSTLPLHPPHSDPENSILLDSFSQPGCWSPGDGEGLGQLKSIKPTINLHKKQKRTASPFLQSPTKKEITGVKKAHEVTKN